MCLVIANPEAKLIPNEYIVRAYSVNSDGFGVMYVRNGKLRIKRGLMPIAQIFDIFSDLHRNKIPYVAHFRYATHGSHNGMNCHPFAVSEELNGIGMVHNGMLNGKHWRHATLSDTALMVNEISDAIKANLLAPEQLFEKDIPVLDEPYEDSLMGSKLVFMNGNGDISFYNEFSGRWIDGVWYSNTYSITPTEENYISWNKGYWMPRKAYTRFLEAEDEKEEIAIELAPSLASIHDDAEDRFPALAALLEE